MNIYLMDLKEVCRTVGFKKTAIYKWMNAGEFPNSIKNGSSVGGYQQKWKHGSLKKFEHLGRISSGKVNF